MAKTQTTCPQCRQPVLVEVEQVFDMAKDPLAKQKLLSNQANFFQFSACGYQGLVAPIPVLRLSFWRHSLRMAVLVKVRFYSQGGRQPHRLAYCRSP